MNQLPDPEKSIEVSPQDVARWLAGGNAGAPCVVDCREADELRICQIDDTEWVPLARFPERLGKFQQSAQRGIVIFCHHGMRSLHAARFLREHGIHCAFSMAGGIDAWSRDVDPRIARY